MEPLEILSIMLAVTLMLPIVCGEWAVEDAQGNRYDANGRLVQ